jgi:hypothetical protein
MFKLTAERHFATDRERQQRVALAARWYWLAEGEEDGVNRFLEYWIVIESLEVDTTNVKPVVQRLSSLLSPVTHAVLKDRIRRLFGLRGALVHGKQMVVDHCQARAVELIAKVLLTLS